ncbi:MAG: ATP-binding protein [Bryobacteraceae bacterium]|jgi:signal transduction histidine kinase
MPALDWLRPPRYVLTLSLMVTLAAICAMAWLGSELLAREQALDAQRVQESLENVADRAVSMFQREIAGLERFLSAEPATSLPEFTVAFTADRRGMRVQPPGGIVYYPAGPESGATSGDAFRAGESAEFGENDPEKAIVIYRGLAASRDSAVRAGTLLRLGRTLRKAKRWGEAMQSYAELAALGAVRTAGLPAALVGREARCTILSEQGQSASLAREAGDLCRELEAGRWEVSRGAWLFLREEAQNWLPAGAVCAPVLEFAISASAAADALWQRWHSLPATGHALSSPGGKPVLSVWAATPERLSAVLAGNGFLEDMCLRVSQATGMQLALTDERDRPILCRFAGAVGAQASRKAAATNLPWSLSVALVHPRVETPEFQGRRRILLAGFALASLLVLAGGYFTFRGIYRELAVARLQSDFVSAVSHEFRTPLTSLRQFSEMLATGRLVQEERRQRYYEAMAADSGRLQRLVEELLNFGRMETGAMRYRLDPLDAVEVVRSVAADFERQLDSGRVELSAPETPCPVRGDRDALSLAVWNLLDNAFKYSPECPTVRVEVARNGTRVAIAVRDQGVGIPRRERKRIFHKFERGAGAIASGQKGTGVGLAIVRHVARGHRGEIRLESEPGRGSTFTLLLPAGES